MTKNPLEIIFKEQAALDEHIHKKHNLTYAKVMDELVVALGTELAELANEIRCFKFWSVKEPSADEVIIEEYVDGLHFITSIALANKMKPSDIKIGKSKKVNDKKFLNMCIKNLFFDLSLLDDKKGIAKWYANYLIFGQQLGFKTEQVVKAYLEKCKINHQRQDNNY